MSEDWKSEAVKKVDFGLVSFILYMALIMLIPVIVVNWDDVRAYLMNNGESCWVVQELKDEGPIAFNTCTGEAKKITIKK